MQPILILKVGQTLASIQRVHGDFEDWFAAGLKRPVEVCDARHGRLPEATEYAAIVVSGSGAMVSEREPWSERAASWLGGAVQASIPVLGVCYGHQLLAHALGGVVAKNPQGREIGTKSLLPLAALASDPLLQVLRSPVSVQTSHEEAVLTLPPNTRVLATTAQDSHHVLRFAEKAWGLQFHPEFDAQIMRMYLQARCEKLSIEGLDVEQLLNETKPTPQAWGLMRQFAQLIDIKV